MAGQPIARRLADRIEADGGDDVILGRVASGDTVKSIASDYGVGYDTLRRWLNAEVGRKAAYVDAKRDSADALVDEAGEILDNAPTDSAPAVTKAVKRADHKRWLAGKRDREQYGDDKTVAQLNVALDLGSLHLDALRAAGSMADHLIPEADVEILTDDGDGAGSPD